MRIQCGLNEVRNTKPLAQCPGCVTQRHQHDPQVRCGLSRCYVAEVEACLTVEVAALFLVANEIMAVLPSGSFFGRMTAQLLMKLTAEHNKSRVALGSPRSVRQGGGPGWQPQQQTGTHRELTVDHGTPSPLRPPFGVSCSRRESGFGTGLLRAPACASHS